MGKTMANDYGSSTLAGSPSTVIESGLDPGILIAQIGDAADALPPQAAERLRELQQQRDDAHALVRIAVEETQEIRNEIHRRTNRLHELRQPRGMGGYNLADNDPRVAAEQASLNKAAAELERRNELSEARGARWGNLSTLVRNCENWIRRAPSGFEIALHAPIEAELSYGVSLQNA